MKRIKKHKLKREKPETSTSYFREQDVHDLAYYIHDRVELMHQVFSVLKYKELKAIAPECVRNISVGDLQELCTEELLGISSKRLCAILDGAEPPSDTESSSRSSSPELETISLDSISSDEEILSQDNNKKNKKHKHKHRNSKAKSKSKKKSKDPPTEDTEVSKASRAGLTVLELLELQARARAIRAQLQQEQAAKRASETAVAESTTSHHSSDNEVMIKEEPQEVVEISSEDEKPSVQELEKLETAINAPSPPPVSTTQSTNKETVIETKSHAVTKRISDLIITVPQKKPSRKIKLNRNNNVTVSVPNIPEIKDSASSYETRTNIVANEKNVATDNTKKVVKESKVNLNKNEAVKSKEKSKKKQKRKKKNLIEKDGSDHDEITLQLSDTEKMDLLEDLDRKTYENDSSSVDSESSSSDSEDSSKDSSMESQKIEGDKVFNKNISQNTDTEEQNVEKPNYIAILSQNGNENNDKSTENFKEVADSTLFCQKNQESWNKQEEINKVVVNENDITQTFVSFEENRLEVIEKEITISKDKIISEQVTEIDAIDEIPIVDDSQNIIQVSDETTQDSNIQKETIEKDSSDSHAVHCLVNKDIDNESGGNKAGESDRELSEGEVTDRESSEVEAVDLKPEVVYISDEEASKSQKKKKKKDKKSKKEKKSKKSKSDFREDSDQNFYEKSMQIEILEKRPVIAQNSKTTDSIDVDDVYEILELSDDSSCYEVEGTVLSKEPTAEEIQALSAKIDEIEREEVITEEQIREHERFEAEKEENIESVSWKDRYLGSKKVIKVLTTSNIFNALRKKNKELKKKLEESKRKEEIVIEKESQELPKDDNLEEGSIEHYNTLEGSIKYVDRVLEPSEEDKQKASEEVEKNREEYNNERNVTTEMKKDAKQLLKMYRKLLKYNDINKQNDPNKKKKKKTKKKKEKCQSRCSASVATTEI